MVKGYVILRMNFKIGVIEKRPCFHRFCVSVLLLALLFSSKAHAADYIIFDLHLRELHADEAFVERCKKIARLNWVEGATRWIDPFLEQYGKEAHLCQVMDWLTKSKQPEHSFFDHKRLGRQMYQWINPNHFGNSLGPRLEDDQTHFSDVIKVPPHYYKPYAFEIEEVFEEGSSGWYRNMNALAAGDFDGDGLEDILVEYIDECLGMCTYYTLSYYILSRKGPLEEIQMREIDGYVLRGTI